MPQFGSIYLPDSAVAAIAAPQSGPAPGFFSTLGAQTENTLSQLRYGLPYAIGQATGGLSKDDQAGYAQKLQEASKAVAPYQPASVSDVFSGRASIGRFALSNLAALVPQAAGMIAGGLAGEALGGPVGAVAGAVAAGTPGFAGQNAQSIVDRDGTLSEDKAQKALLVAPFQAGAAEAAGYKIPGLGRLLGNAGDAYTGSLGVRIGKSMLATGATQAAAGAAMEAGSQFASGDLGYSPDSAGRLVDAAVGGLAIGGLLGSFGGIKKAGVDTAKLPQPDDLAQRADDIINGRAVTTPNLEPYGPLARGPDGQPIGPFRPEDQPELNIGPPVNRVSRDPYGPPMPSIDDLPSGAEPDLFNPPLSPGAPPPKGPYGPLPVSADVQARIADLFNQSRPATPELPLRSEPSVRGLLGIDQASGVSLPPAPEPEPVASQTPASETPAAEPDAQRAPPLLAETDKPLYQPPSAEGLRPDEDRPLKVYSDAELKKAESDTTDPRGGKDNVERERNLRVGELNGAVPTDDTTFQQRLAEAKQGLRGSFVNKLEATSPADLVDKVVTEAFDNQSEASSVRKLAQRLGLMDDKLNPTPWAADLLKSRDDAEQAKIKAERDAAKNPAPQQEAPAAPEPAPAAPEPAPPEPAPAAPEPAAPEPQKSAASEPAKASEPAAPDDVTNKPIRQGSIDLDPVTRLNTMIDALRSSDGGKAAITRTEADELRDLVSSKKFDEAHKRMGEILAAKEKGEFTKGPDDQQAAAQRRRTREEAQTPKGEQLPMEKEAQVEDNAREADRVKSLQDARDAKIEEEAPNEPIENGPVPEQRPAEPEGIVPNEPIQQAKPPRNQAEAKAAKAQQAEPAAAEKPVKTPKPKFEVDRAVPLREAIEDLRKPVGTGYKGLTDAQAQALHDLVDKGKYDAAMAKLDQLSTSRDRAAELAARKPIENDVQPPMNEVFSGTPDESLVKGLEGKTAAQAAKYLADNAPSRYHRSVFDAISKLAERLEGPKWKSEVKIVRDGDIVPSELLSPATGGLAYADTLSDGTRKVTLYLKDPNLAGHRGVNYITAGHELLHAVTMDALNNALDGRAGNARTTALVSDLNSLRNAVVDHMNKRIADYKAGKIQIEGFERQAIDKANNSMQNIHELLAYGLTHPEMQEYLQSIPYKQKTSVFQGLVNSVRKLLGLGDDAPTKTALTEIMRIADDVLRPDRDQISAYQTQNLGRTALAEMISTPQKAESSIADASKYLSDAVNKIDIKTAGGVWNNAKKAALYFSSLAHVVRMYGDSIAGTREYEAAHEQRAAISQRLSQLGSQAFVKFEKLSGEAQDRVRNIMGLATEFSLDPTKALDAHTWLTDAALKTTGVSRERIAELHKQITNEYNTLKRQGEGADRGAGAAVFDEFRSMNDMQALIKLAQSFHTLVGQDELLRGSPLAAMDNPVKSFIARMDTGDTAAGVKYFRDLIDAQLKAGSDFLEETRGKLGTADGKAAKAMRATITPLDTMITGAKSILKGLDEAPYFHLGRSGDFFGTAEITKGEDGYANPESQKAVAKALTDEGFTFAQMSTDNRQPRYMIRFDSESDKAAYDKLALKLAKDGHIDPDTMKSGPRDVAGNFGLNTGTASMVKRLQEGIENSPLFDERPGMSKSDVEALAVQRSALKNMLSDIWLDAQPDTAIARVMARRETRPGYDKDMAHSWITRWQVGSNALANLTTMPDITNAMSMLKDTYDKSLHLNADGTRSANTQDALNVMRELQLREVKTPVNALADKFDKARGWASTFYLGANPAYVLMQTMQLGTNALPELAKKYGYAKSFSAMRAATGDATEVMRAIMKEMGPLPLLKKADALAVTENALNNAKINPELRAFLTRMMATGAIDIGSMARAAQQAGDKPSEAMLTQFGKHAQMVNHMAAMPATGIELYTRLIAAFAAQRLHGDYSLDAQNYASNAVKESMFRYQNYNTARAFGKAGFLGRATPIVAQFMSYSMQMIEKLHGEMTDAFAGARPGESAADVSARKAAAQRFLIGHSAAVTTLAGTMGLPFATVFAAVLDKGVRASGITGQQDWDATAAYRDFLSSVLGKDVGEVVAHGLPRAIGMDVSSHIGEGGLLPLTDFLASKRSWKDSLGDEATRVGAMPSMFGNLAAGGSQIADGHVLQGMITLLPTGFKNIAKVYQMAETGYVDGKGEKLPLSPTATAYLSQLLGYTPSAKAEYMEAKADQNERKDILRTRSASIRQDLVNATLQGDSAGAQSALDRATAFDKANIGFAITPTLGRALQKTLQQHAFAAATQSPVGTPVRDVAGQALTRYANVNYQQ